MTKIFSGKELYDVFFESSKGEREHNELPVIGKSSWERIAFFCTKKLNDKINRFVSAEEILSNSHYEYIDFKTLTALSKKGLVSVADYVNDFIPNRKPKMKTITKDMIGRNNVNGLEVVNYHPDAIPTPHGHHFRMAGHHWLAKVDGDKRIGVSGMYVYQWSPVQQLWFETNCVGTDDKPVRDLEGAVLVKSIEQPECPLSLKVA